MTELKVVWVLVSLIVGFNKPDGSGVDESKSQRDWGTDHRAIGVQFKDESAIRESEEDCLDFRDRVLKSRAAGDGVFVYRTELLCVPASMSE